MQISFRHLENCSPAQKWVSVVIYDVRTSSVIGYLRGFHLSTTFCIVCFEGFSCLYHSYCQILGQNPSSLAKNKELKRFLSSRISLNRG